jgi:hypothetical protein
MEFIDDTYIVIKRPGYNEPFAWLIEFQETTRINRLDEASLGFMPIERFLTSHPLQYSRTVYRGNSVSSFQGGMYLNQGLFWSLYAYEPYVKVIFSAPR